MKKKKQKPVWLLAVGGADDRPELVAAAAAAQGLTAVTKWPEGEQVATVHHAPNCPESVLNTAYGVYMASLSVGCGMEWVKGGCDTADGHKWAFTKWGCPL